MQCCVSKPDKHGMTDEEKAISDEAYANSGHFREMALALERNEYAPFGGAFVIVPPKDGGDVVATLLFDKQLNPSQFWAILKTKCEIALNELMQQEQSNRGFGRR